MSPRLLIVLCLLPLLAACGFQLRGSYGIDERLQPMYIAAGGEFGHALTNELERGGIDLTADRNTAASVLEVIERHRDRRVLAIAEDGRADEYEILYTVDWRLLAGDGADSGDALIAATRHSARDAYIFDPGRRLAADAEEEVLEERIRAEVAERILRRIEAWSLSEDVSDD